MNCEIEQQSAATPLFPNPSHCVYTKQYCEENVWKLCDYVKQNHPANLSTSFAVFISNKDKTVPLWCQKSSAREDRLVIWDYHVIFIHQQAKCSFVYDLDTELPFPCQLDNYFARAIMDDTMLKPSFRRLFRVVPADVFLDTFASDRSHMLKEDGSWVAPPPVYSCIRTRNCHNNLADFISMDEDTGVGSVLTTAQLLQRFAMF